MTSLLLPALVNAAIALTDLSGQGWKDNHALGVLKRAPVVCKEQYSNGSVVSITRYPNNHFRVICRRGNT